MIRYSFQLNDFRHWLNGFSQLVKIPVLDGALTLPPSLGDGYIHTAHLPAGLSCVVMNFRLTEDLAFFSQSTPTPGLCLFFHQVKERDRGIIFLSSTRYNQETTWSRDSHVKKIGLLFSPSFLRRYVRKDILDDLLRLTDDNSVSGNKEPIPFEYRQLLEDIFSADRSSPLHHLLLQNRILQLAEKFLHSFLTKTNFPPPDDKAWAKGKEKDLEALKSIVNMLSNSQLSKFPSIEALSKAAMMSSTKLKSRFKQIYGMKLYEFYNRHRLGQAKEMLKTGNYSVKQVGVNIGFSNLSNFAKAFRKEFGVLPKEVLKNK